MNNKPENAPPNPGPYNKSMFKVSENEIYMIKDANLKKISDILKSTSTSKKPSDGIIVDEDLEQHNQNIITSMANTRNLFKDIFDVKETKDKYKMKFEKKFEHFQNYLKKLNRTEKLQKAINSSLLHMNKRQQEEAKSRK